MSNSTDLLSIMVHSSRSDVEPVDPDDVPSWVADIYVNQLFQVAVVTIVAYDAIITMDREVKYFWKHPKAPVDYVYFLNRYIGIFGAISNLFWQSYSATLQLCKRPGLHALQVFIKIAGSFAQWSRDIANWVAMILIDYILLVRVLALYSNNKRLAIFFAVLLVLEATFKLGLIIFLTVMEQVAVGGLAKGVTACGKDNTLSGVGVWLLVDWLLPMVYGVILMIFALYKAAEYWKMSAGFKGFTLVKVLIEDQVLYFMLVISCSVINILTFSLDFSSEILWNILPFLGDATFLSVLGSRMLLSLKDAGDRGQNEGTSYRVTSRTVSGIDFAEPAVVPSETETEGGSNADGAQTDA